MAECSHYCILLHVKYGTFFSVILTLCLHKMYVFSLLSFEVKLSTNTKTKQVCMSKTHSRSHITFAYDLFSLQFLIIEYNTICIWGAICLLPKSTALSLHLALHFLSAPPFLYPSDPCLLLWLSSLLQLPSITSPCSNHLIGLAASEPCLHAVPCCHDERSAAGICRVLTIRHAVRTDLTRPRHMHTAKNLTRTAGV